MDILHFDKHNEQELLKRLEHLCQKGAVLGYYQLQGLLFAIACSPEHIQPYEWFDLIWLNDEPQFDNEQDARDFYRAVVRLSEHVGEMAQQKTYLPFNTDYSEQWQPELTQWCDGLLIGHQYLEDVWSIALGDLNDSDLTEDVEASLSLACTFADPIRAKHLSLEQGVLLTDEHFPEVYTLFRKVLAVYASVGWRWSQLGDEDHIETLFKSMEPSARHKPCLCGSGLIFAKCCLH